MMKRSGSTVFTVSPLHTFALCLCVCLCLAAACSSNPKPAAAPGPDVWAVVDGREIRQDDVEKAYRAVVDPGASPSADEVTMAKLSLLNDLITQDLLLAKATAAGLTVTEAEIDTAFNERKKNMPEDAFQKQLADRKLNTTDMKENLRRELLAQKLLDRDVGSTITVSDQDITAYYNANRGQFSLTEPAYHIAQIVITPVREDQLTNRQNDDATTPEAAARKAQMVSEKLRSGTRFSELAMDYSEDAQSAPQGGDLGFISASQLKQVAAPLREAVLKAQPGTISQVSVGGAYTLVLLIEKEAAGQRDLNTPGVRDNISRTLHDRKEQLARTAYLTVLRNDAHVMNYLAKQLLPAPKPQTVTPTAPGKK
jgi:peptidyl-prolyl cis-trans isomerase SurA